MRRMNICVVLVTVLINVTGCATIMSGSDEEVAFSSHPPGASIIVDGIKYGVTPKVLTLKRGTPHSVTIELEGYESYVITLETTLNGWVWGNILLGGVIGVVVDMSTGAVYQLTPKEVEAHLDGKTAMSVADDSAGLAIAVSLVPADSSWKKVGQMTMAK